MSRIHPFVHSWKWLFKCTVFFWLCFLNHFLATESLSGAAPIDLPRAIERNRGQFPSGYDFGFRGQDYLFLINSQEIALISGSEPEAVTLEFLGAETAGQPIIHCSSGKGNYLIGPSDQWVMGVPLVESVVYPGVYPGIDLQFRISGNLLEYDLVVAPGVDPNQVRLEIGGADSYHLDSQGDLIIEKGEISFVQRQPHVFQETPSGREEIECRYRISADRVSLDLAEFDRDLELVVDPVLTYLAVLPGNGSESEPQLVIGPNGRIYIAGTTESTDLATQGGLQNDPSGGTKDGFVLCLSPDGSQIIFLTYLGGENADHVLGLDVDETGIYLTGRTSSRTFPTHNALFDYSGGGESFITKLSLQGNALHFSTFLGGSGSEYGTDLEVGSNGVFVTGWTGSDDFPTKNAFQGQLTPTTGSSSNYDYFLTKVDRNGQLMFSTYLGGNAAEFEDTRVAVSNGQVYVGGATASTDFPLLNAVRNQVTEQDTFLASFNSNTGELLFSTLWGGDGKDDLSDIAVGPASEVYLVGRTRSSDFPVVNPRPGQREAGTDGPFISKFDSTNNVAYSHLFQNNVSYGVAETTPEGKLLLGFQASASRIEPVNPLPGEFIWGPYLAILEPDGRILFSSIVAEGGGAQGVAMDQEGSLIFLASSHTTAELTPIDSPFPPLTGDKFNGFFWGRIEELESPREISSVSGSTQSARVGKAFPDSLQVKVSESTGEGVADISVTFSTPNTGASAAFDGGQPTAEVLTDSAGIATSPPLTANSIPGDYDVVATAQEIDGEVRFSLTNLPRTASSIENVSGDGQVVEIGSPLPQPFTVRVLDEEDEGLPDQEVMFTAPSSGASGAFLSGSTTSAILTDAQGVASSETFTANLEVGTYTVIASVAGLDTTVSFSVTNTIGSPSLISAHSGSNQVAPVDELFPQPLQAIVTDVGGNPFEGITVTFAAPESGPSGTFAGGSNSMTVLTDAQGLATSSAFTANSVGGSYNVIATADEVDTQASFPLRNSRNAILTAGSKTAARGTTVKIPIQLFRGNDIVVMSFRVGYDPNLLTLQGIAPGSLLSDHLLEMNSSSPGQIRAAFSSSDLSGLATGPSSVIELSFELSDVTAIETTSVRLSSVTALSADTGLVEVDLRQGLITVIDEVCPGDLNVDTSRDVRDLALILGHILGQGELSESALLAADLNNDQIVDVKDLVLLLNGITGAVQIAPCQ